MCVCVSTCVCAYSYACMHPFPQCFPISQSRSAGMSWWWKNWNNSNTPPPIFSKTLMIITNLFSGCFLCSISEDVEFCGYTITHPSESKINFRIQTRGERRSLNPALFVLTLLAVSKWSLGAHTCVAQAGSKHCGTVWQRKYFDWSPVHSLCPLSQTRKASDWP